MTPLPDPISAVSFHHFGGDADFVGMVAMLYESLLGGASV